MSRIVVLGGRGFFGGAAVTLLRDRGRAPLTPARGDADAGSVESLRRYLRPGDIVLDAAGPFQDRSMALVDAATEVGADVVDISDSLDYAVAVEAMRGRIEASGVRVLNCCSSVSAVSAAMVEASGIEDPRGVAVCLVPASGETSTRGTAGSVLRSVGGEIRVRRHGRLVSARGWSEHRNFRMPLDAGRVRAHLTESADAVTLPIAWPGLMDVDFWVDAHAFGVNRILRIVSMLPGGGRRMEPLAPVGVAVARRLGAHAGGVAVEVTGADGGVWRCTLTAERRSYLVAVLPAVMAIEAILGGGFGLTGLIPVNRHVAAAGLTEGLRRLGVEVTVV